MPGAMPFAYLGSQQMFAQQQPYYRQQVYPASQYYQPQYFGPVAQAPNMIPQKYHGYSPFAPPYNNICTNIGMGACH